VFWKDRIIKWGVELVKDYVQWRGFRLAMLKISDLLKGIDVHEVAI
jgi:hypothetical protein